MSPTKRVCFVFAFVLKQFIKIKIAFTQFHFVKFDFIEWRQEKHKPTFVTKNDGK